MIREINSPKKILSFICVGLLLTAFTVQYVLPVKAAGPSAPLYLDDTETPTSTATSTSTPTTTPTPSTGLTFNGSSYGCTAGPYITCSASVTSTHTDPYR